GSLVFSMVAAILVVLPRVRLTSATSLFWGTWHINQLEVRAAHDRMDQNFLFNEYMENATNLSLIAKAKYQYVGRAFRALIVAVLSYVALLITAAN
ncbi:MAG TPA: Pycsar system effector family protein, partial [Tianweitania sediminis]|nr:Pycsar system effector family protein [Tianweitania sediminis]